MCIMRKLKTKIKPVSYLFSKCEINHVSSFFLQFLVFFLFIKIRTNILNNSGVIIIIMTSTVLWQKLIYICSFNHCWLITVCDVIKKYLCISQIEPHPGSRNLPSLRDLHYLKYLLRHQYKAIDFLKFFLYYMYILFIKITYLLWIKKTQLKTVRVIFYFSLQKTFLIYLLWRFLSFFCTLILLAVMYLIMLLP